jgi:hypothetical protein
VVPYSQNTSFNKGPGKLWPERLPPWVFRGQGVGTKVLWVGGEHIPTADPFQFVPSLSARGTNKEEGTGLKLAIKLGPNFTLRYRTDALMRTDV